MPTDLLHSKPFFACNDLSLNSNLTHPYSDLFNDEIGTLFLYTY